MYICAKIERHFTCFFKKYCKAFVSFICFWKTKKMANNAKHVLPLYYNPVPQPCSRSAWFLAGLFFGSFCVLALEEPSLFYNFFKLLLTLFSLAIDFYMSKTGKAIVKLYTFYQFTKKLMERKKRGDNMIPPFFTWILQDYPDTTAGCFLRSLNQVRLNKKYKKISKEILKFVCVNKFSPKQT